MSGLNQNFAHVVALVESASDAIVGLNLEDRIILWNRGAENIYGYSASEAIGKCFSTLVAPPQSQLSRVDSTVQTTSSRSVVKHCDRHGRAIELILTVSPIEDGQGQAIGKSIVAKRVSEPNLPSENTQEWISVVSHELRTPLTSIAGSLGLLLTGKLGTLSPQGQRMLEIAANNTERLLRLLNDFLELQRLQANEWFVRKQQGDLLEIMHEAADIMQSLAHKNGVEILVSETPISIGADRDRLVQLLVNLLSNAIKFSPANSQISLSATLEPNSSAGEDRGWVVIKVADRGRGIPLDKQQLIFESFEQVDPADAREKQGTGLGLAICRSIVHQHQGEIWVESQLGEGSTFYVKLPLT